MKKVVAIVRLEKFDAVKESLGREGFAGMTVTPASGAGTEKGVVIQWRGKRFQEPLVPRVKIEIVAPDIDIPKIADTICRVAKTGKVGGGMA